MDLQPLLRLTSDGSMSIPVAGGKHLKEDMVGSHFADYDFVIAEEIGLGTPNYDLYTIQE